MRSRIASGVASTALVAALLLLASSPVLAEEPRVLRVVGVQPLDASAARAGGPRQGAINAALFEAVSRVAHELVDEYGMPVEGGSGEGGERSLEGTGALPDGWLKSAFGDDMTPYARSFRIVEDQGSRPVLFKGETRATHEYVVVVEVAIDVEKVRDRLAEKGLIALDQSESLDAGLEIEARGLSHWSGYEAFVALLRSPRVGASEVQPLEFETGRVLLFAKISGTPEDVLDRIVAAAPPELEVSERRDAGEDDRETEGGSHHERLHLVVLWTQPPASPPTGARSRR